MSQMSDDELRSELRRLGITFGPITETTRAIYFKKIKKVKKEQSDALAATSASAQPQPSKPERTRKTAARSKAAAAAVAADRTEDEFSGRARGTSTSARTAAGAELKAPSPAQSPSLIIPGEANICRGAGFVSSPSPSHVQPEKSFRPAGAEIVPGKANLSSSARTATAASASSFFTALKTRIGATDRTAYSPSAGFQSRVTTKGPLTTDLSPSLTDGDFSPVTKPPTYSSLRDTGPAENMESSPFSLKADDLVRRRLRTSEGNIRSHSGTTGCTSIRAEPISPISKPRISLKPEPARFEAGVWSSTLCSEFDRKPSSLASPFSASRQTTVDETEMSKPSSYRYNGIAGESYRTRASWCPGTTTMQGISRRRPLNTYQSKRSYWHQGWIPQIRLSKYFSENTPRHVLIGLSAFFALLTISYLVIVHTSKVKTSAQVFEGALVDTAAFVYGYMILPMLMIAAVATVIGLLYLVRKFQRSAQQRERKKVFALVEKVIETVRERYEESEVTKNVTPYIAIPRVRDMLISPYNRNEMMPVWEKAVKYLDENESRIRTEVYCINGEEVMVWRWLQTGDDKIWQGHAFPDDQKSLNMPILPYFECLKLRGLFEADLETEEDWPEHITDAILEKLGDSIHVVHMFVDVNSKEGCVYLRLKTGDEAGEAYRKLHGSWFNGRLVSVKFMRPERYEERFPQSRWCTVPLTVKKPRFSIVS